MTLRFSPEALEDRIAPALVTPIAANLLEDSRGTTIYGSTGPDGGGAFGTSVALIGDLNDDGFDDFAVGAPRYSEGAVVRGAVAVYFGDGSGDYAADGTDGFLIKGKEDGSLFGIRVAGIGDFNDDGIDDMLIGAPGRETGGDTTGAAYVVYGKSSAFAAEWSASDLNGTNGFEILGVPQGGGGKKGALAGTSVSGLGDVNGDGISDFAIGSPGDGTLKRGAGMAHVVFGSPAAPAVLQLAGIDGTNGFALTVNQNNAGLGEGVAGLGDVNGDAIPDCAFASTDTVYVVFGRSGGGFGASLSVTGLDGSATGFSFSAETKGISVAGAGDVNDDGIADAIIGEASALNGAGRAFVLFGTDSGFADAYTGADLDGTQGFTVLGATAGDSAGKSVGAAGDVNGDGVDDFFVGSPLAKFRGAESGSCHVIFGQTGDPGATLALKTLGGQFGLRIDGAAAGDRLGTSAQALGDVNGDGFGDLLVGSPFAGKYTGTGDVTLSSGAVYVALGDFGVVNVAKNGKSATFVDTDGDIVSVKISKGNLALADFSFDSSGVLQSLSMEGSASFGGTALSISAKTPKGIAGDKLIHVGQVDATGLVLGNVKVGGDLGCIIVGPAALPAQNIVLNGLSVRDLGSWNGVVQTSGIDGGVGSIKARNHFGYLDVTGGIKSLILSGNLDGSMGGDHSGAVRAGGSIGSAKIAGDVIGGANLLSGLVSGAVLGKVSVTGDVTGVSGTSGQVLFSGFGNLAAARSSAALAIKGVAVKGSVFGALILGGYSAQVNLPDMGACAQNPDAGIGAISVGGNWAASSVVAGIVDSPADGFGRNDLPIAPDPVADLVSAIASVVIKGSATGGATWHYGISAQSIGKVVIGGLKILPVSGDDLSVDAVNGNFHIAVPS